MGFIWKSISSWAKDIIMPFYKSLVRLYLEYMIQFCSPTVKKDSEMLDNVPRTAVMLIHGLDHEADFSLYILH